MCPRPHTQKKKYPAVNQSAIHFGLQLDYSSHSYVQSKGHLRMQEAESEAVV